MLEYLGEQYQKLDKLQNEEQVYNLLTLEIIKILEMILKFELFWKIEVEPGKENEKKPSNRRGLSIIDKLGRNIERLNEID